MAQQPVPAWIGPAAAGAVRLAAEAGTDVDDILEHADAATPDLLAEQIVRLEQSAEPGEVAADLAGLLWAECEDVPPIATILEDPASQAALEAVGEARRQAARRLAAGAVPPELSDPPAAPMPDPGSSGRPAPSPDREASPGTASSPDPFTWPSPAPAVEPDLSLDTAASLHLAPSPSPAPAFDPDRPLDTAPTPDVPAAPDPVPVPDAAGPLGGPSSPNRVSSPTRPPPLAPSTGPLVHAASAAPPGPRTAAAAPRRLARPTASAAGRRSATGAVVAATAAAILLFGRRLRRA